MARRTGDPPLCFLLIFRQSVVEYIKDMQWTAAQEVDLWVFM